MKRAPDALPSLHLPPLLSFPMDLWPLPDVGPRLVLQTCAAGAGDGLADQSSQLMAGTWGAVQIPDVRPYPEVHLQHGTTLQANRAPDSPCLQQVHTALVNQQIPYAAHVMRDGR